MGAGSGPARPATLPGRPPQAVQLHASCVAWSGRALLILGASGSGKSGLALQLMAFGAQLVADDRTDVTLRDGWPMASAPAAIRGRIEARFMGILPAEPAAPARLIAAVDLDRVETRRLPPELNMDLLGQRIRMFHKLESAHFAAALLQYLKTAGVGCD